MDEQQYQHAFGANELISQDCKTFVSLIKDNDDSINDYRFTDEEGDESEYAFSDDAENFTDLQWRLLGRCIASNTHLKRLILSRCTLNNEKMALLFGELVNSNSIEMLDLDANSEELDSGTFDVEGIRHMTPFLENSPQLTQIWLNWNISLNTESFELLVQALHNNTRELCCLGFCGCRISDISVLDTYTLRNLQNLNLNSNPIGRGGCVTISNILQNGDSRLTNLYIINTGMGDEEAKNIASSLKHNNILELLYLNENNITEKGRVMFLKLLNNIS